MLLVYTCKKNHLETKRKRLLASNTRKVPTGKLTQSNVTSNVTNNVPCPTLRAAPQVRVSEQNESTSSQQHSDIYIGGLEQSHSQDDLRLFLHSIGITPIIAIKDLSSKRGWKSFQVTVPQNLVQMAINSPHWSDGIRVRPFVKRTSNTTRKNVKHRSTTRQGPVQYKLKASQATHVPVYSTQREYVGDSQRTPYPVPMSQALPRQAPAPTSVCYEPSMPRACHGFPQTQMPTFQQPQGPFVYPSPWAADVQPTNCGNPNGIPGHWYRAEWPTPREWMSQ